MATQPRRACERCQTSAVWRGKMAGKLELLDVSFIRKQSGQIREKLPSCHSTLYGCHDVCCHGRLTFFSYYALYTYCRIFVRTVMRVSTSATTDAKLEGCSRGLDTDPFLFLVRSFAVSRCMLHPHFTHSLSRCSFLLLLNW